jgi:putative phage-type endonuclease
MDAVRAILEVPVIQQRSAEWYEKRKARITASEVAAILGENPYEGARDVMLRKRGLGKPFTGNIATRYGQAHEAAAIAAYCAALGRVSFEVGLIDYEAIHGKGELSFLAGSPDGITVLRAQKKVELDTQVQSDGPRVVRVIGPNGDEPRPLVSDAGFFLRGLAEPELAALAGRADPLEPVMLEVKCPFRRAIVHGVIPAHYYAQVQINMLICGLPRADFVEYRPPPNFELNIVRVTPDHAWLRAAVPRLRAFHDSMLVACAPCEEQDAAREAP